MKQILRGLSFFILLSGCINLDCSSSVKNTDSPQKTRQELIEKAKDDRDLYDLAADHKKDNDDDILFKKIELKNASTADKATDRTYIHTTEIIKNPRAIAGWKETLENAGAVYKEFPQFPITPFKNSNCKSFGVGEFSFSEKQHAGYLLAYGVLNGLALVAYDHKTGRSCLYNISTMHLGFTNGKMLFLSNFLPKLFEFFGRNASLEITILSGCFSPEIMIILLLLENNNLKVSYYNIPDVFIAECREYNSNGTIKAGYSLITVGDNFVVDRSAYNRFATDVLLDVKDGSISICRRYF